MKHQSEQSVVLGQITILEEYIKEGLLAIDPAKPIAVIGWKLHLMYMDDEVKLARWPWRWLVSMGLVERDVRYRRLMKMISIYTELMRGTLQSDYMARMIVEGAERNEAEAKARERYGVHSGPFHFIVMGPDEKPLLLGTYRDGELAFVDADSPSL